MECGLTNFRELGSLPENIRPFCPIALEIGQDRKTGQLNILRPGGNIFTIKDKVKLEDKFPCTLCTHGITQISV
jgi:hypothetical protein